MFRVHHVIPQNVWNASKTGKWLDNIGVKKNALENITILPKDAAGRNTLKNTDDAARSLHGGGHLKKYMKDMQKSVFSIQKRHAAGELSDASARKLVGELQNKVRKVLKMEVLNFRERGRILLI